MKREATSTVIDRLIREAGLHPVLFDIGASGGPPHIWDGVAPHSIYVGFEPGSNVTESGDAHGFFKRLIIRSAVTPDGRSDTARFYVTQAPYCSSTLEPDLASLTNYLISDLFVVKEETEMPVYTIDAVMKDLCLDRIHWFKSDSQGTDLRLFLSIRDEVRRRVLAVDIEPGLIDAYVGEDLFVDAHRNLTGNGFWLSNLKVCGMPRMKRSTLQKVSHGREHLDEEQVKRAMRSTPCWCEARYFRTTEWLREADLTKDDYILLWVFAMLDEQPGFALDLAVEYERVLGQDGFWRAMISTPILHMKQQEPKRFYAMAARVIPTGAKRLLKAAVWGNGRA